MSAQPARTYHFLGNIIRFLAFPEETGGRCAILEFLVAPVAGAPPNKHAGEDESFYVLEGTFDFMLEGEIIPAGPGDFVKIPLGAVHAFTCTSPTPGRLLGIDAPGTMHKQFFTEAGETVPGGTTTFPAPDGPPDIAGIVALAAKAGMEVVVPEGAPA